MSDERKFSTLHFDNIATQQGREYRLEEKPAVYAWFRRMDFGSAVGNKERFLSYVRATMASSLSDAFAGSIGPLYNVSVVEKPRPLSEKKTRLLEEIAATEQGRDALADVLSDLTYLQAPLYIGKARNLRQRVSEHITGRSELLERLRLANIEPERCLLRYRYISGLELDILSAGASGDVDQVVTLVEDILTRTAPAAFNRRMG